MSSRDGQPSAPPQIHLTPQHDRDPAPSSKASSIKFPQSVQQAPSDSPFPGRLNTGYDTPLEAATANNGRISSDDHIPTWPKGWRPWACLFGCFLLMFNSWGLVNAYGTFASYYKQHLLPDTDLLLWNLVGATESFCVLALSGVVGRLLDANYARALVAVGAFFVTLGMFLLSVVNGNASRGEGNYGLIWLTQGFITGLGMACFFVSSSQIAATWFVKRKAVAIGIVASGASISGLIYPMMTKFIITELDFNNAVRCVAGVVGFTALLSFLFCVPNPEHIFRKPETWKRVDVWLDPHAFASPAFNWFTAAISFLFLGFYVVFFNLEEWAAHFGFGMRDVPGGLYVSLPPGEEVRDEAIRTFWLLSIMNGSSTFGRLFSAWFSEAWGAVNIHFAATAIAGILLLCLWPFATTLAPALAFVIIFGAVSGAVIGLPPASMAHILGRSDPQAQSRLGQWTGMMYTAAAIPSLIGPIIAGHLITEYNNNYLTIQMWSGVCLILSALCMLMSIIYSRKGRGVQAINAFKNSISRRSSRMDFSRTETLEKDDGTDEKEDMTSRRAS